MPRRTPPSDRIQKSDQEWKAQLTPEQYHVTREAGTEAPFSGEYQVSPTPGTFHCIGCDAPLFSNDDKYESGCGWPSFDRPLPDAHIEEHVDTRHGLRRIEVRCRRCSAHLGHVFPDGPKATTGIRYCINSVSLRFRPSTEPTPVSTPSATD